MSYCDTCLHKNVCGFEGVNDKAMTFCADKMGWIPVSDRLPEKSGYFLASIFNDKYGVDIIEDVWFAHKNEYDDIEESEWRELGGNGTVIAWMPLPEPYKEEE